MRFLVGLVALIGAAAAHPTCPHELFSPEFNLPSTGSQVLNGYHLGDFNVVSFNNLYASSGDIEGRVLVGNDMGISDGFSIGMEINSKGPNHPDHQRPYAVIAGHEVCWRRGTLFPEGPNDKAYVENGWVGNQVNEPINDCTETPKYLEDRFTEANMGMNALPVAALKAQYYAISAAYAAETPNVQVESHPEYPGGLFFNCADPMAERYYVRMSAAMWNSNSWYVTGSCNCAAEWIITIDNMMGMPPLAKRIEGPGPEGEGEGEGEGYYPGDIVFNGAEFPAVPERVVFNIPGGNRVVVEGGMVGSILAPDSEYYQPQGVSRGMIVVDNIAHLHQANRPVCGICHCCGVCPEPSHERPLELVAANAHKVTETHSAWADFFFGGNVKQI